MRRVLVLLLLIMAMPLARAQSPVPPAPGAVPAPLTAEQRRAELEAAVQDGFRLATAGPATVPLRGEATLKVPEGMVFVPEAAAGRIMRALGNGVGPTLAGLVLDTAPRWVVVINQVSEGYVKDDDAKEWNAGDILKSLQSGTEAANNDRAARGFPEIEVTGWLQPPSYDASTHRLTWAALLRVKGTTNAEQGINYNTRALGRDGYFSINLLTDSSHFAADKPIAPTLLSNLAFLPGKRYEDFNASTDHVAEYGLAALIGVVAAKKLGLLALAGVFVAKFAKIGALITAGVGAVAARLFKRKKADV